MVFLPSSSLAKEEVVTALASRPIQRRRKT